VHGIHFEEFRTRLFKPLEHVIAAVSLSWGDYAYMARHSEIAQIVFEQVLTDPTERFNEYIRIIKCLNPLYAADREALRGMIRARTINDLFPNYQDANAIYESLKDSLKDDPYLLQQRGIYERLRPNGNLRLARSLLEKARDKEPRDSTIIHTLATIVRSQAEDSEKPLERAKLRNEARTLLQQIEPGTGASGYALVTRLNLVTDELKELLTSDGASDRAIDEAIRLGESILEIARQRYPGDSYISVAESEFAKLLEDHERSIEALKRARKANPRDPFIASRLSAIFVSRGELDSAKNCIEEALESNQGDRRLRFQYAEMLRKQGGVASDELAYHYRRAFVQSDENYDSKFWFARYAFESTDPARVNEAREVFRHLREVPMMHENRIRLLDAIGGIESPTQFNGTIARVEASHGFLTVDGRGDDLFFHQKNVDSGVWEQLKRGKRVVFGIGFSLSGPLAVSVRWE
jgi:tetratricopeptide (TPR) repeat protein/cold shock CspA family protein